MLHCDGFISSHIENISPIIQKHFAFEKYIQIEMHRVLLFKSVKTLSKNEASTSRSAFLKIALKKHKFQIKTAFSHCDQKNNNLEPVPAPMQF